MQNAKAIVLVVIVLVLASFSKYKIFLKLFKLTHYDKKIRRIFKKLVGCTVRFGTKSYCSTDWCRFQNKNWKYIKLLITSNPSKNVFFLATALLTLKHCLVYFHKLNQWNRQIKQFIKNITKKKNTCYDSRYMRCVYSSSKNHFNHIL